ncbi:MAG: serine/threonine-protein kinase [bacterium]|nr:serine/threonine-protein kinase [Candidatus Sumerlaeota bacterium]
MEGSKQDSSSGDDVRLGVPSPGDETRLLQPALPQNISGIELIKMIGRGGMGEVWLGRDLKLDRRVAVKMMRRDLAGSEEAVARFYREARAVARLNHPNIIHLYQIGEHDGILYFVMEWVDGESLSEKIKSDGRLELPAAIGVMMQITEGLSYACLNAIVHRDIKPGNILIDKSGRVKLADFGLAKILEVDSQVTMPGATMGSPNFMSPESAKGEATDHRSDIYSLGITFYQMLTGKLPYTAPTPVGVLLKQIQEPLPEPETLQLIEGGAALTVIKRMTAKRPADRYASYDELRQALAALETIDKPTSTQPRIIPPDSGAIRDAVATMPTFQASGLLKILKWPYYWLVAGAVVLLSIIAGILYMTSGLEKSNSGASGDASKVSDNASNKDAILRDTAIRFPIDDRFPELVKLRMDYDYDGALKALGDRERAPMLPRLRDMLQRPRDMLKTLSEFKTAIIEEASKPGAKTSLDRKDMGVLTLTAADANQFVFRNQAGNSVTLKWPDLAPVEVLKIAIDVLPSNANPSWFIQFRRMYGLRLPERPPVKPSRPPASMPGQ